MGRVASSLRWWAPLTVLLVVAWLVWLDPVGLTGPGEALMGGLVRRGRVAVVSSESGGVASERPSGTELLAVAGFAPVRAALSDGDGLAVADALRSAGLDGLLVTPGHLPTWVEPGSVVDRLSRYEPVPGLVGQYLSLSAALYAPDPMTEIPARQRDALAVVARRILAGERPPRVQSFPAPLRTVAHVEVMVLLRAGPRPRLWRSARGSSIARAFLTAVRVAGQRWEERAQAMGAPLSEALPGLTVEISLLQDDGELGTRSAAFIDRVVRDDHGVAYDRKGAWRYLLPANTSEQGRPSRAFVQLLADNGLPPDAIDRDEIRPYRLRVRRLSVSEAPQVQPDPVGFVADPDEVVVGP